jgi:hypothetical protein
MSRKASSTRVREHIQAPDLLVTEIRPIGLEQIPAVELRGLRFLVVVRGPRHGRSRGVVSDVVIPRDARVALLEAPDRFVHLGRRAETALGDAGVELLQILEKALLVLLADRAIFLGAALTAAQEMDLPVDDVALNLTKRANGTE